MPGNKLHIVSFDVPYPPDYGGAIDVFYKIKALHEAGVEVYLHCFEYGRGKQIELNKLCKEVWYYNRQTGFKGISASKPYIVNSRKNKLLLKNLQQIDAPILFEGVHTTYYLNHPSLQHRKKAIRAHNIETDYYKLLAQRENNLLKKIYYNIESTLLKNYESKLTNADCIFSLSIDDDEWFGHLYPGKEHQFIGPFHANEQVASLTGIGDYCLYHGNLSHPENIEAALFLLKEVIPNSKVPFIIAGRNPSAAIADACSKFSNCQLIYNPDETLMYQLIQNAHVHLMISFMNSGMKLKLLNALYQGRHVLANNPILWGTELDQLCFITSDAKEVLFYIEDILATKPFSIADIEARKALLQKHYSNTKNAEKIITWMRG